MWYLKKDVLKETNDINEEVDAGLKELEQQDLCISIKNLYKKYSNGKKAVTNLSLTMYNSQIFALLGRKIII